MFKKISLLTVVAFFTGAYADIVLDLHLVFTENDKVTEVSNQVVTQEDSLVELYRCASGQLIGFVNNVDPEGGILNVRVSQCTGEGCTPATNFPVKFAWNDKTHFTMNHQDKILKVEVIATQVQAANN